MACPGARPRRIPPPRTAAPARTPRSPRAGAARTARRIDTGGPAPPEDVIPTPTTLDIGRYQLHPFSTRQPDNRFAASVSIRSGRGSASQDRVLRLARHFDCATQAVDHALNEGLSWLHARGALATPRSTED